ncbi:MAG TPA: ABC transporter permease [Thermoanaerobaculia bacterium]|nr:ABC transporter permease [Thermoanaerobaculia bacterium]
MNNLLLDLRYAVRNLRKARGFAAVAILTLAIALGANTAIYSIFSAILLRPLPFPDAGELVAVRGSSAQHSELVFSLPSYDDVRKQARSFEHVAGYRSLSAFLFGGSEPELLSGGTVTANLFPLLGVKPLLGRTFTERDDAPGQSSLIAISYELWQRRFGGDPTVVGRSIRIGPGSSTVIGVMPRGFKFPVESTNRVDFWIPLRQAPLSETRGAGWITVVARLRDGVSIAQANAELEVIAARMAAQHPDHNTGVSYRALNLHDLVVSGVRPALLMLTAAVSVVLLIGCANVANLLLARAAARDRESSIRAAVGATRARLIRQLLVESLLLSLIAGAIGLLLAIWGVDVLVALAPADTPRIDAITLDASAALFALVLSVLTGILFGLAPALSASKTNLAEALKDGSRGSTDGHNRNRTRNALVIAEIALSVVLLAGAGLLLRSFLRLNAIDPGYDYRGAIAARVTVSASAFPEPQDVVQFHRRALEELRAIPGVTAVGGASELPLMDETTTTYGVEGRPQAAPGKEPVAAVIWASPNYFEALGNTALRGRTITDRDGPNAPPSVVVSETLARQSFGSENPVGKRLLVNIPEEDGGGVRTIVGVVRDIRSVSLTEQPRPAFYLPVLQAPYRYFNFVVRAPNAASLGSSVRAALRKVDRDQAIYDVRTLDEMRSAALGNRRFILVLVGLLATLALVLAAVGIYSIVSYSVARRIPEIGIRMALGAEPRDIFRLVVRQAVRLVGAGLIAGIVIALATTRLMTALLYGITTSDPVTFFSICFIIGGIALIASYVPALRATKVDPLVAIRYD